MAPPVDKVIAEFDRALRTVFSSARSARPIPGEAVAESQLSEEERRHACGLMRVNHCGEICAQALYQGQALTAKRAEIREALRQAGEEETEHLAWTEGRIRELGGQKSLLNPAWYAGALALGSLAGVLGERWNLGFLAETERQVGAHLQDHLARFPAQDEKSRHIIEQMMVDEASHAATAERLGAAELPWPIKRAMKLAARLMTGTAYHL